MTARAPLTSGKVSGAHDEPEAADEPAEETIFTGLSGGSVFYSSGDMPQMHGTVDTSVRIIRGSEKYRWPSKWGDRSDLPVPRNGREMSLVDLEFEDDEDAFNWLMDKRQAQQEAQAQPPSEPLTVIAPGAVHDRTDRVVGEVVVFASPKKEEPTS